VKSFFYALILLAVLIACVLLLHSIDIDKQPQPKPESSPGKPVVLSVSPVSGAGNQDLYANASAAELYSAGLELLGLWHVREATSLFERAIAADSVHYGAHVKLIECYSHPLIGREDSAIEASRLSRSLFASDADTLFLKGLHYLFVDREYAAAAVVLGRAEKTEVSHADAAYYSALALFRSGKIEEARRKLEDLLQADESVGPVLELSIRCAVAAGELNTAREQGKQLARMYSEEPYPYVLLAQIELLTGNVQAAEEFCNNALILDSKYIPAVIARSNLYAAAGQFEVARVSFEKLLLFDEPVLRAHGFEGIGFVDLLSGNFDNGVQAMDEAIRLAILVGAIRRGLTLATNLVGYLCELGQADAASAVVDRWVTGFGDVPVSLARFRIDVLEGNAGSARNTLMQMQSSREWAVWMGMMSMGFTELSALTHIGLEQYDAALEILSMGGVVDATGPGTRAFLGGYAQFQNGEAEAASEAFGKTRATFYGVEFPYRGDPILYVRSLFYMAETELARGNEEEAPGFYELYLGYWGEADWDLQATARAREKLSSLTASP
jgi:tetratricopeptide (TPR) repeat protein